VGPPPLLIIIVIIIIIIITSRRYAKKRDPTAGNTCELTSHTRAPEVTAALALASDEKKVNLQGDEAMRRK